MSEEPNLIATKTPIADLVKYLINIQHTFQEKLTVKYPLDHREFLMYNLPVFEKWQNEQPTGPTNNFLFHLIKYVRRLIKSNSELNEILASVGVLP